MLAGIILVGYSSEPKEDLSGFFDAYNIASCFMPKFPIFESRHESIAENRYNQLQLLPKIEHTQKSLLLGGILHGIKPIFQI